MQPTGLKHPSDNPSLPLAKIPRTEHIPPFSMVTDVVKIAFSFLPGEQPVLKAVCRKFRTIVDGLHAAKPGEAPKKVTVTLKLAQSSARQGFISLLQWYKGTGMPFRQEVCEAAAAGGQIETLKWLRENGAIWNFLTIKAAALNGHMNTLIWLRDNHAPWSWDIIAVAAAESGHVNILEWCRLEGTLSAFDAVVNGKEPSITDWYRKFTPVTLKTTANGNRLILPSALNAAVRGGHVVVLQYLLDKKIIQEKSNPTLCPTAANRGHLEALQWLRTQGFPWGTLGTYAFDEPAGKGRHLDTLKWANKNGLPLVPSNFIGALLRKDKELFTWLRSNNCPNQESPTDESFCEWTAKGEHWDLLKKLHAVGMPWDEQVTKAAAAAGNLKILQWATSVECPVDRYTLTSAAQAGHLEILKLLFDQYEWEQEDLDCIPSAATKGGHLHILKWLHGKGLVNTSHSGVFTEAAKKGHLHILEWTQEVGMAWHRFFSGEAVEHGQLRLLQYAKKHGCPLTCIEKENEEEKGIAYQKAIENGHLHVIQWLHEEGVLNWNPDWCVVAAENGELDILSWAVREGLSFNFQKVLEALPKENRAWFTALSSKQA